MLNTTEKVCISVVSYETIISITAISLIQATRIDN